MPFTYHSPNLLPPRNNMIDPAGYNKVALITGCASGMGLATTQLFLSHQYSVLGVDIQEMDFGLIDERDQERFHFHKGDLRGVGEPEECVRICVGEFGPSIDVLANIAGVMDGFAAADVFEDREWDNIIAINLTVPTKMIRAVLPFMKEKKNGSIINVASRASLSGATSGVAYTASQHGLLGVTKNTAFRFRDEGIRCNAILPGAVAKPIITSSTNPTTFDPETFAHTKPVTAIHLKEGDTPHVSVMDIANATLYLASSQARMINGIAMPIDNGWSAI